MTGTRCTVAVCANSLEQTKADPNRQHIKYHRFPKDPYYRQIWVRRCRRAGVWNPDTCQVCSTHFTEADYERDLRSELLDLPIRKKLRKEAIPTLRLSKEEIPMHELPRSLRKAFTTAPPKVKKGRGRPRKIPIDVADEYAYSVPEITAKRKRGRPRKQPILCEPDMEFSEMFIKEEPADDYENNLSEHDMYAVETLAEFEDDKFAYTHQQKIDRLRTETVRLNTKVAKQSFEMKRMKAELCKLKNENLRLAQTLDVFKKIFSETDMEETMCLEILES